jgi:hypothetical protein
VTSQFSSKVPSSDASLERLKGWLPVDAVVVDGKPGLWWIDMKDVALSEPFFHETVARVRSERPSRDECFTEFDAVIQLEKILESVPPTGFIFHSSRCGSTLVANACRVLSDAIVLGEANAIDKLVARFITDAGVGGVKEALYSVFLRGVVNALAQRRTGSEKRLFIKFSCCSVSQLERISRVWPSVPWVFIYRDPIETMVSNLNTLPDWMQDPDHRVMAGIIGCPVDEITAMSREELCARAIGSFYTSACTLANDNSLLLNYRQLSVSVIVKLLKFFQVEPSSNEVAEITRSTRFYSKDASRSHLFAADAGLKQGQSSDVIQEMAEKWAVAPYNLLERKRTALTVSESDS